MRWFMRWFIRWFMTVLLVVYSGIQVPNAICSPPKCLVTRFNNYS